MMKTFFFLGGLFFVGVVAGCGSHVVLDGTGGAGAAAGSSGTTGGSSGTAGGGGGLAPGQCRSMNDCMQFDECVQPGGSQGCGVCGPPPMPCDTDADCAAEGPAAICILEGCTCDGAMTCVQGCTSDAACSAGETCASNHRCVPEACAAASDCPVDFTCVAGACQRASCTDDAACTGYCVDGACFETPGTCEPIPV